MPPFSYNLDEGTAEEQVYLSGGWSHAGDPVGTDGVTTIEVSHALTDKNVEKRWGD